MSGFTGPERRSIKARLLATVRIPSLALLLVGLGVSGFLADRGIQTYRWADNLRTTVEPGTGIVADVQLEWWLSPTRSPVAAPGPTRADSTS